MVMGFGIWKFFRKKRTLSFSRNRHHLSSFNNGLHIDWPAAVFAVGNKIKFSIHPVQYDEGVRVAKGAGDGGCAFQRLLPFSFQFFTRLAAVFAEEVGKYGRLQAKMSIKG